MVQGALPCCSCRLQLLKLQLLKREIKQPRMLDCSTSLATLAGCPTASLLPTPTVQLQIAQPAVVGAAAVCTAPQLLSPHATHLLLRLQHQQLRNHWLLGPLFLPKPTTAHTGKQSARRATYEWAAMHIRARGEEQQANRENSHQQQQQQRHADPWCSVAFLAIQLPTATHQRSRNGGCT